MPDILKQTQVKLQEAQQMRLVAERNCEDLSREVIGCKDKIQTLQNQLDVLRSEHQAMQVNVFIFFLCKNLNLLKNHK